MSASSIEWTDETWNPVKGCVKISPGCKNCYAETFAERFRSVPGHTYEHGFNPRFAPEHLDAPFSWKKPRMVFVNSMSDLFYEGFTDDQIGQVLRVMEHPDNRKHTFQVLTKRSERMLDLVLGRCRYRTSSGFEYGATPNVWLGVSVEDRKHGLPRIAHLRETPAALRFLSIEPLLEDIGQIDLSGIHWVIVGGESGNGARPFDLRWARSIVAQCQVAGVPVFVKQIGARPVTSYYDNETRQLFDAKGYEWPEPFDWDISSGQPPLDARVEIGSKSRKGGDMAEWPEGLRVRQFPEVRP